jgi:NAD(P)H-hydrate repair Nnr-like enzyme with NAD(P)H-hydrate epimerase domain
LDYLCVEVVEVLDKVDLIPAAHRLARSALIVDALLGTGFNPPLTGLMAAMIGRIDQLRPLVLAVDIPSGLGAPTGEPLEWR